MPKRFWETEPWSHHGRGRPSNRDSKKNERALKYLALIAVKYNINPRRFFDCIKEAYEEESRIKLKNLNVTCRGKKVDSAIFLFTEGSEVIAQFPISTIFLQKVNFQRGYDLKNDFQRENDLKIYMDNIQARQLLTRKVINPKIKDLRAGMKKIHLKAKVLEIPEPNLVYTRLFTQAYVSNILLGDETGTIRMSLWNRQINMVSKDDMIEVENGKVASFRGQLQLRLGRKGCLNVI